MSTHEEATSAVAALIEAGASDIVTKADWSVATVPDRVPNAELTLRSMEVYLPEEPITINGQAYQVAVDEERLTRAVNFVAEESQTSNNQSFYPRQLVIDLQPKQSSVQLREDTFSEVLEFNKGGSKLLRMPDGPDDDKGSAILLTLPRETISPDLSTDGIAKLVTHNANQDLLTALGQNIKAKDQFRLRSLGWGLALAAATGEGVGIATAENGVSMLERGSLGAAIGGAAMFAAFAARQESKFFRMGGHKAPYHKWAIWKARKKVHDANFFLRSAEAMRIVEQGQGQIISLEAIQSEESELPTDS